MKVLVRSKPKSPTAPKWKPPDRSAPSDAWAVWLETISAKGIHIAEVLSTPSLLNQSSNPPWLVEVNGDSLEGDRTGIQTAPTLPLPLLQQDYSETSILSVSPPKSLSTGERSNSTVGSRSPSSDGLIGIDPETITTVVEPDTAPLQATNPTLAPAPVPSIAPAPDATLFTEQENPEVEIATPQVSSWFQSKALSEDAPDPPPDDESPQIEQVLAQSQPITLPYQSILESRLGQSLNGIKAYGGTTEIQETLNHLDARAALYNQQILFAEPRPELETVAHEVIHALQSRTGASSQEPELLSDSDSAEQEAHWLTQDIVRSVQSNSSDPAPSASLPWTPIQVRSSIQPFEIARLREAPPPTLSESAPPRQVMEATAERGDRTPAPPQPTPEPAPSEAQAETEATLAAGELAPPVSGELEEVPALEAPTPPEPGITEADVAAREAELAQAEAALANAADVNEKVDAYAAAPPTLKAQQQSMLGADLDALAKSETASFQEEIPDFQVELSGETEELPELQVEAPPQEEVSLEAVPPAPAPDPDIPPTPDLVAYTANESILRSINRFTEGNSPQDRAGEIGETLDDVRTTDPDVETSPGEPPAVPLEGETDPDRMTNQLQEGRDRTLQSRNDAQQAVVNGPGPEQVQPLVLEEAVPLGELAQPELPQPEPVAAIEDFKQRDMPPEVNTAFDLSNQETMQASLAEAQSQVQQTTEERDRTRQEQLNTAQTEAEQQTLQSDQDQRNAVQAQRERIQDERQNTLEQQTQAVQDIESQAETRRDEDRHSISDRVRSDQEAIRTDYQQAERDADAEVSDGERQAETERREAEQDAEEESWWDRAVSFVQEAFEALTSAISAIFDAVRAAVNAILDAVKAAAEALIALAADFIKSAIAAFGEFLKGLVDGLLGDLFPGLAAALNEFIDAAVELAQQAVDAVAEALRNGINALVEGLRAGLNAVLDAMQAGLEFASNLIQAALTGDWGAVVRLLLEAVLQVIGIEPETFYGFIGRAQETFQKILDDPGAVVGHLLDAVKLGIQQFADNFLPHLQTGIIGWLTGAMGSDIEVPTEFNLIGVLDLARQIMGLTLQFIRRVAVRLIGEENVERIESLIGYVQTLITGGWAALFEQITESLGNLRDMVLDQIKEFIVTRLILAAVTKLATMFNPVGAIVQLVLTAWNIYTFLRDNLQNMIQIVQSIVEGISQIVNGNIAPAGNRVEQTLANLLPVAISFLANLLGIGGIANRVRQTIDRVRDRIENAIVNFIRRIGDRFTGRGRRSTDEQAEAETVQEQTLGQLIEIPGQMDGTPHTLKIDVSTRLIILESTPAEAIQKVEVARNNISQAVNDGHLESSQVSRARQRLDALVTALRQIETRLVNNQTPNLENDIKPIGRAVMNILRLYGDEFDIADIVSPLEGYPVPQVGRHDVADNAQGPEPPGGWESHHVPPKALATTLSEQLRDAGRLLRQSTWPAAQAYGETLITASQGMRLRNASGDGLSAILINEATHRNSRGAAIHSSELSGQIAAEIERRRLAAQTIRVRVLSTSTSELTLSPSQRRTLVNPTRRQLREFANRTMAQMQAGDETAEYQEAFRRIFDEVIREFQNLDQSEEISVRNLREMIEDFLFSAFDDSFEQARAAVAVALRASFVDGDHAQHAGRLNELRTVANQTWMHVYEPF